LCKSREGLTKHGRQIGRGRRGGWVADYGKRDPRLAKRIGTTQEWEWCYRIYREEAKEERCYQIYHREAENGT
jgi:hypothetical protein